MHRLIKKRFSENAHGVTKVRIIKASQLSEKDVHNFLKNAHQINVRSILQSGYMLEVNDEIRGCFVLEEINDKIYELKTFYLVSTEAIKIPTLFEAILSVAKENNAKKIFVYSQKLMTDIILELLDFYPQENSIFPIKKGNNEGKWWSYTIMD